MYGSCGDGEPRFYLWEVSNVEGEYILQFEHATRIRIVRAAEIVASGGDFAAIGYEMVKDQPVAGSTDLLMRK